MLVSLSSVLPVVFATYLIFGALFVIPLQIKGLKKIDEGVRGSGIGFRIIIVPGCILLWPVLLKRWIAAVQGGKK